MNEATERLLAELTRSLLSVYTSVYFADRKAREILKLLKDMGYKKVKLMGEPGHLRYIPEEIDIE